jgi:hypothetical protein
VCGFDLSPLDKASSGTLRDEPFVLSDYGHVLLTMPASILEFDAAAAVADQTCRRQWRAEETRLDKTAIFASHVTPFCT